MKMTETIDQDIADFEKAEGITVSPRVRKLISAMAAAGDQFEELGKMDARSGRARRTKEAFIEWGKRNLGYPEEKDDPIVDLMFKCYLDGFDAVGTEALVTQAPDNGLFDICGSQYSALQNQDRILH